MLEHLWYAISRTPSDEQLTALAIQTARIPLYWLATGIEELAGIWEPGPKVPTMRTIFAASLRAAGFRARWTPETYIDPTPATVRWWPPAGRHVGVTLAERWGESPERIGLPGLIPAGVPKRDGPLEALADGVLRALPEHGTPTE